MKIPDILEIPHLNKVIWYMTLCVWPLFSMARKKSLVIVYILRKKEFIWQIISIVSMQRLQHHVWNLPHILSKNRTFTSLHSLKYQAPLKKWDESFFLFLCFVFYDEHIPLVGVFTNTNRSWKGQWRYPPTGLTSLLSWFDWDVIRR